MKILISGSTGHIGGNLTEGLQGDGHEVHSLVRYKSLADDQSVYFNYKENQYDIADFEGFDVIIHLGGENILGLWTKGKKERIRKSRVESTEKLSEIIGNLEHKPQTFICASAVGYYGDRGNEILTEESEAGRGFLPEVSEQWEKAAADADKYGVRVVNLRTGMVLDPDEGPLKKMLTPFKLGLGGNLGSGNQYWSWISIDDEVNSIKYIVGNNEISGPVNLVSPEPSRNMDFTEILGEVLNRPTFFNIPEFILKTVLGDMSKELFLCSTRAVPEKLLSHGYEFKHKNLRDTIDSMLGK